MATGERAVREKRHPLRWVIPVLVIVLLVLGAVYALQAWMAYRALDDAAARIPVLREQLTEGAIEDAQQTADAFAEDTGTARGAVHGPHWTALGWVPGVGPNVDGVQAVTEAVDDLAAEALPPLVEAATVVDPGNLAPKNGRVDLAPLEQVAPQVQAAHAVVEDAAAKVAGIDTAALLGPLQAPVADLDAQLSDVRDLTGATAKATRLLPSMLGADGPRRYLILTQNNAEPRALGGIPGAVILMRADEGRIRLVEQRPASSFGNAGTPVLKLSRAERALFGTQLGRYMQNVTSTPDFPRAARLARALWRDKTGVEVDGVASIDPYALQLLLEATGPVRLPSGDTLNGDNAAEVLLNGVYQRIEDPTAQDAFFALAAGRIFNKVTEGAGDVRRTATALTEAGGQGRLLLWSADEAEQEVLAGTRIAGELRGDLDGDPLLGIYLHDRSGAKIAFYEEMRATVEEVACDTEGSREFAVSVTVQNKVPGNVRQLPDYLTGGGNVVRIGSMRTEVLLYAPAGGLIAEFRSSDGDRGMTSHIHEGLQVVERTVTLRPGRTVTLEYDVRAPAGPSGGLRVRTTPGPTDGQFFATSETCGS